MAGKLGKFQMVGFNHWRGTARENHLGAIYQQSPQKATDLMVKLMAYHHGNSLESFLSQFPTKEFDDDSDYYWDIVASNKRNVALKEARTLDGTVVTASSGMIGAGLEPFFLVFPEDWFADGETLEGELNELYQLRILGEPTMEGSNAVYRVELMGGNTVGMPAEQLLAGKRFSRGAAFVEREGSRKVGGVRFSTPVSMRNEFSTIRKQHKVFGNQLNKKLAIGIPVVKQTAGKYVTDTTNMWMHYVDWTFEEEFSQEKNWALAWGRSNRNTNGEYKNIGKSGSAIKTGAGLFEQSEVANTFYYSTFSLKLIEDALLEISASKIPMKDRYFVIKTGEYGALQFNKAVMDTLSGWKCFVINGDAVNVVSKTSSEIHPNALKAGYQFTEYESANGIRIKLEIDPFYDDVERNKIRHPEGGVAMSRRYDIMYMGSEEQPNIFKCAIKGTPEYRGYQWGPFRNPFTGEVGNNSASTDEDCAIIHKQATFGICLLDPTRTITLCPSMLAG